MRAHSDAPNDRDGDHAAHVAALHGTTTVALYTITKGSHTWPGADPAASPLYTTKQIDATKLMLAFFAEHRLAGT